MLTTLRIKNLALVTDLTLELDPGYNAITGETGAGKSILIGALSLVLGERADRSLLRAGCESCSVEAAFDVSKLRAPLDRYLADNGLEPCEDHQLVLKRTLSASGANRQFVNGSPSTLAALGTIGQWLVDIHGPHDHQSLLHPARQLDILDAFGRLEPSREAFAALVQTRAGLLAERAGLIMDDRTYRQRLDLLRHQVREIRGAELKPEDEERLEQEHRRASHAARLLQLAQTATGLLADDENALLQQGGALGRTLREIEKVDPGAVALTELHEQGMAALRELQSAISQYAEKLDVDPQNLQDLEDRLNLIQSLKRKYGSKLADVIAFGESAGRELERLDSLEGELGRLNTKLDQIHRELLKLGGELSAQRRKVIPKLSKSVARLLADLGFKQSHFDIAITTTSPQNTGETVFTSTGLDQIEFQFAPNPGEPPRPLRAIASSGELARVMLALKTVLAAEDEVPVLIFDEVDANVGGETAVAVGEKMRQIAAKRQVLCITHLAPVAASADAHFEVTKETADGRTVTRIERLDREHQIAELARMLGGQSATARKHAEAMLRAKTSGARNAIG